MTPGQHHSHCIFPRLHFVQIYSCLLTLRRVVQDRLGGPFDYASAGSKLKELQASLSLQPLPFSRSQVAARHAQSGKVLQICKQTHNACCDCRSKALQFDPVQQAGICVGIAASLEENSCLLCLGFIVGHGRLRLVGKLCESCAPVWHGSKVAVQWAAAAYRVVFYHWLSSNQ